ncbi:MAG: helix-turn-helix domain-containing protein [Gemmatimonadaceae bacterium]|nr:helix-turn-helix domain-containing protein [Gemmatimonadaceae bacterium]
MSDLPPSTAPDRNIGPVPVTTILTPSERSAVDAAGLGLYRTMHRSTLDEVRRDLRDQSATAVLLSLACCSPRDAIRMAAILRDHPRVPMMALVTNTERVHPQSLLSLGRSGLRIVIDARESAGWRLLRETVATADRGAFTIESAIADLRQKLIAAGEDLLALLELCLTARPALHSVRQVARHLRLHPGTLTSRFQRAGLPPLKRYLDLCNLIRAAHRLEDPRRSIADVATSLDYSSPQSFGRHVRLVLGVTASAFRSSYDCEGMYRRFCDEVINPVLPQLIRFRPLSQTTESDDPGVRRPGSRS